MNEPKIYRMRDGSLPWDDGSTRWWMWDAHMKYWKQWQSGWGFDGGWTHWSPISEIEPPIPNETKPD